MFEWLLKLKAADPVAISGNTWNPPKLTHVDRVTKTQICTRNGRRWRKKDGTEVGSDGYGRPRLLEWTPEMEEKVERAELERWLIHLAQLVERKEVTLTLEALRGMRQGRNPKWRQRAAEIAAHYRKQGTLERKRVIDVVDDIESIIRAGDK